MTAIARLRTSAAPAFFALFALTACDEVNGPDIGEFDPASTAEVMDEMASATEGMDEALASIELAGPAFGGSGSFLVADGGLSPSARASKRYADAYGTMAFFPSNWLGTTFVYHEGEQHYIASDEPGAPEDGVRVIYYAMDPVTEKPASPLVALGHVDLRDLSSPSSDRLGIQIVNTSGDADVVHADYYIDAQHTQSDTGWGATFSSVGYISNGTDQLNFDLSNDASFTETAGHFVQDFSMDLEGTDLSVSYVGEFDVEWQNEESATMHLVATIANGGHTVVFDVTGDASHMIEGTVAHNGVVVAHISGHQEEPSFTRPDGTALSQEEMEQLGRIFHAVEKLFDLAEDIFDAAGD